MPTTRTMTVVTLAPAILRSAYPEFGGRKFEVQYIDLVPRKDADASAVLDSDGKVLGAVYRWDDGEWTFCSARELYRMPEDTSHMTDDQWHGWSATCAADARVIADGIDAGAERRTLITGLSPANIKSRAKLLAQLSMVLA